MKLPHLLRVHAVSHKTPMRLITGAVGQVFTPKGGGVRAVEMRFTQQSPQGMAHATIEVTETMKELEAAWPGFARLRQPANDGGLEFLMNVEAVSEYSLGTVKDVETQAAAGEAVAVHLEGRAVPILVGMPWAEADELIQAARQRVNDFRAGLLDIPAEAPDAGLVTT